MLRLPRPDYYGLVFATRLPGRASILSLTAEDTPAVFAELTTNSGVRFRFVGLHPIPPVPGQDSASRDLELTYAARFAAGDDVPVIAMGDFNDAAWSETAQRFKRIGGYLDPRVGRGIFPSFDASSSFMRVPIDQLYVTPEVALVSFGRGAASGSDHFPILATIRLDRELAGRLNRVPDALGLVEQREIEAVFRRHARVPGAP